MSNSKIYRCPECGSTDTARNDHQLLDNPVNTKLDHCRDCNKRVPLTKNLSPPDAMKRVKSEEVKS